MSRARGRGGGRGGGRGRGPAGTQRIGGVDLIADSELLRERPQPAALFPERKITLPRALSRDERLQVTHYRSFRERVHDGPLYAILGDDVRVRKAGDRDNKPAAYFDPFEGMQTYSQRYARKRRKIPKLDTRPYVMKFFPKELWQTLDPKYIAANGTDVDTSPNDKRLIIAASRRSRALAAFDRELSGEPKEPEDDEDKPKGTDDDNEPQEEQDNEYASEDEDDGDYNAEQYFDDGGDDGGDDYDDGGGDAGDNEY